MTWGDRVIRHASVLVINHVGAVEFMTLQALERD